MSHNNLIDIPCGMIPTVKLINISIISYNKRFWGGRELLRFTQQISHIQYNFIDCCHCAVHRSSELRYSSEVHTVDLSFWQILIRLSKLCVQESASVRKSRKQQQRLLRNMGAHAVVLELLQIPYEKVSESPPVAAAPQSGADPWVFLNSSY